MVESFKSSNKHKVVFEPIRQPVPDSSPCIDDSYSLENSVSESFDLDLSQVICQNEKVSNRQIIKELQEQTLKNAFLISKMNEERRNLIKSYYRIRDQHYRFEMDAVIKMSMQANPEHHEDFTYEELLKLEESIGNVNVGFKDEDIDKIPETTLENSETCSICLNNGNLGKLLICNHFFHSECINTWLKSKKSCPFCLKEVFIDDFISIKPLI